MGVAPEVGGITIDSDKFELSHFGIIFALRSLIQKCFSGYSNKTRIWYIIFSFHLHSQYDVGTT